MKIFYLGLFIILFVIIIFITQKNDNGLVAQKSSNEWNIIFLDESLINFKNGESLNTNLYDLKYIGQLSVENKAPYLIMSGRSCQECDENISLYIHSPSDGEMRRNGTEMRYSYPGEVIDYLTGKLIFKSQVYYGNCFEDDKNGVIWDQKFINQDGEWETSRFLVQIENNTLREFHSVSSDYQQVINIGPDCKEITGINTSSEP